jgi:hypothetical protein
MEAQTVVCPYARSCQAAHLLGHVLEHVNEHSDASDADMHFQEAQRISRAAEALLKLLHDESHANQDSQYQYFQARALCYSALIVLYDVHSCIEVDDIETVGGSRGLRLDLQQLAIDGFKVLITHVSKFAEIVEHVIDAGRIDSISPMILHCLYSAGGTYAWYRRETGDTRHLESLETLRGTLQRLRARWQVAGKRLSKMHL